MGFKLIKQQGFPRRMWGLYGYSGAGKSTFSTQMKGPLVVVDADYRYDEVAHLTAGDVYRLEGNTLIHSIDMQLREEMPQAQVGTIVVDSLTQILQPLISAAVDDNEGGRNKNRAAAFIPKAVGMRRLQGAVSMWETDVLWIWHLEDGRNKDAKEVVRETVTKLEVSRLRRNLNALLQVTIEGDRRGIKVIWSRGKSGMTLWDKTGQWLEMPELLERAMYKDVTAEQLRASSLPTGFTGVGQAKRWAAASGRFKNQKEIDAAYSKVREEGNPQTPEEMWDLWIALVALSDTAVPSAGVEY